MPKMQQYTVEFKDQAVRFVFDEMGPNESRKEPCRGLAPKVNVKEVTLYNWVNQPRRQQRVARRGPGSRAPWTSCGRRCPRCVKRES